MHFTDEEAGEVKTWVVKKLEDMYVGVYHREFVLSDKLLLCEQQRRDIFPLSVQSQRLIMETVQIRCRFGRVSGLRPGSNPLRRAR